MSIDTLRKPDGTYRPASYRDIAQAIDCGHTEHLQTERGAVAIRPYTDKGIHDDDRKERKAITVDFYDRRTDDPEHRDDFSVDYILTFSRVDAISDIFKLLNGSLDTQWTAGDSISVWANQAERDGCVLATLGDQIIIEYEMPGTTGQWGYNRRTGQYRHPAVPTSALRVVSTIGYEVIGAYTAVSYNRVPRRWLDAIRASGHTEWLGMGQRSTKRIPFPAEATT